MSVQTSEKSKMSVKEPTYANMPKDIDSVVESFSQLGLKSVKSPTDKIGQVQLLRQERVKDRTEVAKEKTVKSEPIYLNVHERAPIDGHLNKEFVMSKQLHAMRRPFPVNHVVPSGSKRGVTTVEPIYYNMPTADDSPKFLRPGSVSDRYTSEPVVDAYREQMMMRHNPGQFSTGCPPRQPVESDERVGYYQNLPIFNINQNSQYYENLPPRTQPLISNHSRAPVSAPRQCVVTDSALQQRYQEQQYTDYVLNNPNAGYANLPSQQMTMPYQHQVDPVPVTQQGSPSSQLLSPCTPHSSDSIGSPSQYSYSTQPSPGQQTFSQSGSPPRAPGYSQPMFSPLQHSPSGVTSYSGVNQDGYIPPQMSSPGASQNVPSPLSTGTDVSSPADLSLYANFDNIKGSWNDSQQQTSLNDVLEHLPYMEDYQQQLYPTATTAAATTAAATVSYREDKYVMSVPQNTVAHNYCNVPPSNNNISTTPHSQYVLPSPLNNERPTLGSDYCREQQVSQSLSTAMPVSTASTTPPTCGPVYKVPIPALPKPQPAPVDPHGPVVLLVLQPSKPAPIAPKAILPKPSGEMPSAPELKGKGRKPKKGTKAASGASGSSRSAQSGGNEAVIKAKAMISLESDTALLRKENGETVLHQGIRMRKQPVIVALVDALQKRPGLSPLINMASDKEQTPLFLSVVTGQSLLTDTLVKMNANCNALCRSEICQGQVEYLSPLHYACQFGDRCIKEVKAMLSAKSIEVDMQSRSGMTALHLALWNHGHTDGKTKKPVDSRNVIKALLQAGANCSIKDNKTGKSALHFAVENGSLVITRLLLESTTQVESLIDLKNYDHRTPLHFAVSLRTISEENKVDLVQYLISKGASKSCKDKNKLTPRELVSPTQTRILELFSDSPSPGRPFEEEDDLYPRILQSP